VQLFGCLDDVGPGGGATVAVAGSHRLVNEAGRFLRARDLRNALKGEPFFSDLWAGRGGEGGVLPRATIGDVPVEVVELTGAPGDVWLTDLRVLHTGAPNGADRPRMMFTHRFMRTDALREMAGAYGWTGEGKTAPT
jgi:ectoine hydroxylase-related dioxygenase (phytanoyl-CoA dioxygenase family)